MGRVLCHRDEIEKVGVCQLPASNEYAVKYGVSLGAIEGLSTSEFNPNMCGQVFLIDCGFHELDVVVTGRKWDIGLSLYSSTWRATTNASDGNEAKCTLKTSTKSLFKHSNPICFLQKKKIQFVDYIYVGLLNTGNRIVTEAKIDDIQGSIINYRFFYTFKDIPNSNKNVTFTFNDKSSLQVHLNECKSLPLQRQNWDLN